VGRAEAAFAESLLLSFLAPVALPKKLDVAPVLGGAALQRCDTWPSLSTGFSR